MDHEIRGRVIEVADQVETLDIEDTELWRAKHRASLGVMRMLHINSQRTKLRDVCVTQDDLRLELERSVSYTREMSYTKHHNAVRRILVPMTCGRGARGTLRYLHLKKV